MALKTQVVDRVSTYPGRVKMTPVSGQTNVYDMERADSPTTTGTPLNGALFNSKEDRLTGSVTVYVSTSGSDTTGTGASGSPYKTIQKAVDSLPKCLGGFHAQIDIAAGTYNERVLVDGFYGGRLTLGATGRSVTVRGITVMSSSTVRLYISNLTYSSTYSGTLLYADNGSNVVILDPLTFRGESGGVNGIGANRGSTITAENTVALLNFTSAAVLATGGSKVVLKTVNGNTGNTSFGIRSEMGSVVSYETKGMVASGGDSTGSGGRILTSSGTSLANASVE